MRKPNNQYRRQKKEEIRELLSKCQVYCTEAVEVFGHEFKNFSNGVIIPHEIYDLKKNEEYMTLGNSKDIGEFCYECLKRLAKVNYPNSGSILVLADGGGGSNSGRHYIFKEDIQKLADEIGIEIRMAHYPPIHLNTIL